MAGMNEASQSWATSGILVGATPTAQINQNFNIPSLPIKPVAVDNRPALSFNDRSPSFSTPNFNPNFSQPNSKYQDTALAFASNNPSYTGRQPNESPFTKWVAPSSRKLGSQSASGIGSSSIFG